MPKASTSATCDPAALRRALQRWYRANGRHALPWRLTRDPYAVLVSEVMLQQTQVDRVLPHYRSWLQRWPAFQALAGALPAEVIRQWRGLGYNRRALNLHRLAVAVVEQHGGEVPRNAASLRALPGVGPYTAAAILSFAHEEPVVVADTNIARVLARVLLGAAAARDVSPAAISGAAAELLPRRGARDHNLALMDLGALVCTARSPRCEACPLAGVCAWRASGRPALLAARSAVPKFESTARFARGRIVDRLRESPASELELVAALPAPHRPKLRAYLAALENEGLIAGTRGSWSLPGAG